jgi:hypothetical protein
MLERPGDLIPVLPNAISIPWTRRRSQILNFLHRGPVTFETLVYDTNVGDISALATYFNPDRISERELNLRFGHYPASGTEKHASPRKIGAGGESIVMPRLLLYPDHNLNSSQIKVQRTLNWVLSQDSKCDSSSGSGQSGHTTPDPGSRPGRQRNDAENNVNVDTSMPPPGSTKPVAHTMPSVSITTALDSLWIDKGDTAESSEQWPSRPTSSNSTRPSEDSTLGLGNLVTNVGVASSPAPDTLDRLKEGEARWGWGAWDNPAPGPGHKRPW